jgi:hypothetical protein
VEELAERERPAGSVKKVDAQSNFFTYKPRRGGRPFDALLRLLR